MKLHIGCGTIRFDGWVNIDALPTEAADVVLDVTHGIPAPDNSCKYVYNEHFLEHISVEDAVRLIAEVHRILQPGGVLRIAMPSIEVCVARYMRENWKEDEAIIRNGLTWLETKAEMLNVAFRNWGHQWLYDEEELRRRLLEGGFQDIAFFPAGDSGHEELRGRESRQESLLVCEATKR
ncbi:methyltransferase domain-containing protein [Blastopirellula sp. JC732]|uniref:Methyltransferase domain-containing protein n=1 Tax=Blastopirellula sediminis TaxID=2894196 RepID=A0A9X1MLE5_9BACT|nr:methyltransferase domain-containing protein [Blastopirellula sediminis]MCC9608444.1 methyltransferase domain-containing protein [Blastopirellula sediminis]MCC9628779.1 methyltransferase domain-containing protein [Blastopirellula sediminis]